MSLYIPQMSDTPGVTIAGLADNFINGDERKADKQQEAWNEITLQNGWVPIGYARYYKDEFGLVHVEMYISGGETAGGTQLCALPSGYRPDKNLYFDYHSNNKGSNAMITIYSGGFVRLSSVSGSSISFHATFRAGG